jgi:hypothetical protein
MEVKPKVNTSSADNTSELRYHTVRNTLDNNGKTLSCDRTQVLRTLLPHPTMIYSMLTDWHWNFIIINLIDIIEQEI